MTVRSPLVMIAGRVTQLPAADTLPVPAGADGGNASRNTQTGTTYSVVASDKGALITCANASAITVTVPANSTTAIATGTVIYVAQYGAGQVTIAPASGVTLRTASTLKTRAQYSMIVLVKIATDEWIVSGDTA